MLRCVTKGKGSLVFEKEFLHGCEWFSVQFILFTVGPSLYGQLLIVISKTKKRQRYIISTYVLLLVLKYDLPKYSLSFPFVFFSVFY